ncbi:uncharacterized protein LOC127789861 isoform X2 [Diospyros lotus]|uniref:uncharacterized protein LOC127789861 isoform X2 n=1 Tax=Diospyros lotus TaxID=55363 RepID=UPI00224C8FF4|nr:uncharacterized protein LOC127789861 isoform X2 [Diospyros lotus]
MLPSSIFLLGFLLGALAIFAAQAAAVVYVIIRLKRRAKQYDAKASSQAQSRSSRSVSDHHSLDPSSSSYRKKGAVWVLEPEKLPKAWLADKVPGQQKQKKEIFEVSPVHKYAEIKDDSIILTEADGSRTEIQLKGCTVVAVSASSFSSRKWARRYPIKVESKISILYKGSKTVYLYLETSWEKESWCKALRLASCNDKDKLKWFSKLDVEFQSYLATLNTGYPSFIKPGMGFNAAPLDRSIKLDGSSSKVRHFLKRLAKKMPKSGPEIKTNWNLSSIREERKLPEKCHSFQDAVLPRGIIKSASTDSDDKIVGDEGTLCWNLLISRLFFDVKSSMEMKKIMQARFQRTLSNMRTPSYIGDVTCTGIDLGDLPPYINGMRVLPSDMNEVWSFEIDVQYAGGVVLDIETRLEVRELDREEGLMETNFNPISEAEVPSDLLEDFENFEKQLGFSDGTVDRTEQKDEACPKIDGMKSSKSVNKAPPSVSRWKSILNSITKHVSQVPLSLGIRVASLRGTLRLHIKPPPSDQLWFEFTSMPDIDFNLDSSVGEHKINSGHIALLLVSRFKAAIRETLVFPFCESISLPGMLAEKDDWVPRAVAPFIWINQESVSDPDGVREGASCQPAKVTTTSDSSRETANNFLGAKHENTKKVELSGVPISQTNDRHASLSDPTSLSTCSSKSMQELSTPLLRDEEEETCSSSRKENTDGQSSSQPLILAGEQIEITEEDDARPKRMGTRAKMLGLGKKMGEKFEEKRRHIEEKSRHIVERMRGPP